MRETTLQTPRSVQKEGRRCSRHWSRGSLQPMKQTMVRQAVPAAMEAHGGADPHLQPGEDPKPDQGVPEGGCDPVGSPTLEQAPGKTCDPVGDPWWSSLFLKDGTPWKGPTLGQFVQNCSPWEGPTLKKSVEDGLPWEGPHTGPGEECEEEGAAETCDELTTTPIPRPPVPLRGKM